MSTSSADTTRFLTNREFPDQEKAYIQKLLLLATNDLRHVEEQIARLACQQAKLASNIFHYKVAIAPHKMLPEHILQLIFQWCIPPDGLCVPTPCDRGLAWPSFTQVCSSWRKLAMDSTPELWRDVTMELKLDRYNGCRIDLAHQWLSRAGDMPRSLKIQHMIDSAWECPDCEDVGSRLVVPFRFRSLDLALSSNQFRRVLSLLPQTQSLESLQLTGESPESFPPTIYEGCSAYNLIAALPWSQLLHLSINNATTSASTLINVLGNCLVLEQLSMILCPDPASCNAPASFITLPSLKKLKLYFVTGSNPEIFFHSLILPQIESLDMTMTNFHTESMPGCTSLHFATMAQRSGMSRIHDLCLGKGVEPYRLVDLLKYTPSLSYLEVSGDVVFDSETLEDMSTGQLGPNIRTLYLPHVEDSLGILEMIWMRGQNDKNLVTPTLYVTIPVADRNIAEVWVDKLQDLGIDCVYDGEYIS